ncbi:MAG TPA: epimerase, partial [Herpetosiphonaceae bacterium]
TFIYVSGEGADSSERGRVMWARVRGKTENDLLKLPFKAAYVFRPGIIQPLHGITSRTRLYRAGYAVVGALLPLLQRVAPNALTTTEQMGRAMLAAARRGAPQSILRNPEINRL